jgi:hypothetical protein
VLITIFMTTIDLQLFPCKLFCCTGTKEPFIDYYAYIRATNRKYPTGEDPVTKLAAHRETCEAPKCLCKE